MTRRGSGSPEEGVVPFLVQRMIDAGPSAAVAIGGSPPVDLPDHVVAAAAQVLDRRGYVNPQGDPGLREAIAGRLRAEGIAADSEHVLITNGAMHALDICFRVLLGSGENVVMPLPGFFIGGLVERAGGVINGFASDPSGGFQPDWDAGSRAIDSRSAALYINSPVNPTGYVYRHWDLEQAAGLAARHNLFIVSDESHSHFLYRGAVHTSISTLPEAADRTILIRSFSKDYAMPGWRLGYMLMPPRLAGTLKSMFEWSSLCVNPVSQAAGQAALTGPRGWIDRFVADAERSSAVVAEAINSMPRMRCAVPGGGLNLFVGFDGPVKTMINRMVLEAGVPVHPGEAFGVSGYFRFQLGATEESLGRALESMRRIARELQGC
jgi:aspartate aminotransferase